MTKGSAFDTNQPDQGMEGCQKQDNHSSCLFPKVTQMFSNHPITVFSALFSLFNSYFIRMGLSPQPAALFSVFRAPLPYLFLQMP